jgi:ElaB/YqjD/DUF883 family membrane-anchored ribosome-binding protein
MALEHSDTTGTPASAARSALDMAERARSYAQDRMTDLLDRARDLTGEADQWVADIREFVRTHPLQALAATVGLGFILGKVLRRR